MDKIQITFSCDAEGNHRVPINLCVDNQIKEFDNTEDGKNKALKFIDECTYVHNLEEVLDKVCHKTSKNNQKLEIEKF